MALYPDEEYEAAGAKVVESSRDLFDGADLVAKVLPPTIDEVNQMPEGVAHQERVARMRDRPVENKWIGQRISDPDIDLAAIGRAQGAVGWGPIERLADLASALATALQAVIAGNVAVVDVRVQPGYTPSMTAALTANTRR